MSNAFNRKVGLRKLMNLTPFEGCLLLFNVNELQVRQRAAEIGLLLVSKVSDNVVGRHNRGEISDMYVVWKDK